MTKFKYFILIFLIPIVIFTNTVNAGIEVRGEKATGAATWNAANFPAFWYDIDTDKSTEALTILGSISNSNRIIEAGNLQYNTFVTSTPFELYKNSGLNVDGKSNYNIIGWQAEKWNGLKGTTNKIVKIAFEMGKEDKKTLTVGETWSLGAGYELTINAIDARTNPRQVWFTLKKDGAIIDEGIGQAPQSTDQTAKQKAVYYKTKTILGESNTLLFTVYVDTIFSGATSDMVQFKYAWLIDESSAREIKVGDLYGVFDVKIADRNNVKLSNRNIVGLAKNTEATIMGNIKFKVADSDTLRYYPFVPYMDPGKYEVRGKVFNTATQKSAPPSWNAQTFPGFWYDLDSDQSAETLSISGSMNNANRFIEANTLTYRTSAVPVNYIVTKAEGVTVGGSNIYNTVGWVGEKYVKIKGIGFKFAKLALEMGKNDKKTLTTGETWSLGAGYELTINAIDARTTPRQVWFTLKKDGAILDEGIGQAPKDNTIAGKQKAVYTKTKTIMGESDVPFFTVYVDNIFSGATSDMVQFKYAWLIDQDSAKQIKVGDRFGVFEVTGSNDNTVVLTNKNRIQLSSGLVDLMGGIKFRVANDPSSLRFSPITNFQPYDGVSESSYSSSTSSTNSPAYPTPTSSSTNSSDIYLIFLIFILLFIGIGISNFMAKKKRLTEIDKTKIKKPDQNDSKPSTIVMPPPKKIEILYTLIVEVKSGYNKTPIQKAIIMLEQQYGEAIERTSDIDGKVIFGKVKEGTYKLRTVSKGYEDHNQELKINQNNRLVIELKGTATLNISVFDALNERPLVGADIRLGDKIYNTDDKGNAIISDIAFGSHILSVLVDSYKVEEFPLDVNEIIYYKKIYLQPEIKPDEKFVEIGNNLKISLNESMKKLSSACDMCIPEYYLSNCNEIIRLIQTISTTPFYADMSSKEKILSLYFIADRIFKETEKILTNEDNISDYINMGYKGYKNTASVALNYSEYNPIIHLYMTDPKQFIEKNKNDIFNKMQHVDQEITQNLQIYNVTSIANLWNISQKIIRTDTKDEIKEAASLLLGSILLDKTKEMFKNEEIIKRIKK